MIGEDGGELGREREEDWAEGGSKGRVLLKREEEVGRRESRKERGG